MWQLLETYLEEEKAKQGSDVQMENDDDDEKGWGDWDVESDDSSEESSDGGWMNVDSDDNEGFDVSDSDDDKMVKAVAESVLEKEGATPDAATTGEVKRVSTLATTKVHISCIRCLYVDKSGNVDFNTRRLCIATRTTTKRSATSSRSGCRLS
jgi:SDA1